eukprot:gene358-453_t
MKTLKIEQLEVAGSVLELGKKVGAGLAAIGLAGAGVGVGVVFAAFVMAVSSNPNLKGELFKLAMLGFALTEAVGLLALMISNLFSVLKTECSTKGNAPALGAEDVSSTLTIRKVEKDK